VQKGGVDVKYRPFRPTVPVDERRLAMAKDLTVVLENRPGTLADMGEALGRAGINIEGLCGAVTAGSSSVHVLVEDAAGALQTLKANGFEVSHEREVLVLEIEDRPGALGAVTRQIAEAGVNIDLVYLATNTRLVIGADNLDKARGAV
jgi:hypothetical protein